MNIFRYIHYFKNYVVMKKELQLIHWPKVYDTHFFFFTGHKS